MPLELDTRQRAMLREMGVHVWLPESTPAVDFQPEVQVAKPSPMVRTATPPPVASLRTLTPAAAPPSSGNTASIYTAPATTPSF